MNKLSHVDSSWIMILKYEFKYLTIENSTFKTDFNHRSTDRFKMARTINVIWNS